MTDKKETYSDGLSAEQKLSMQADLVNMMVHDLKTPIMEIMSNVDLLVNSKNVPEMERGFAETSFEGSKELYDMVQDILNLGKLEAGAMRLDTASFDMGELVESELKKFARQTEDSRVKVTFLKEGDLAVEADEKIIGRVIANLISNGLKYSPPGKELQVFAQGTDDSVTIRVKDQGPGIPSGYRDKIFDKYFQVDLRSHQREGSTGLGLPFCKMAVEAHGGEIGVKNETEEGSDFSFFIPKKA